jgi:small-conductance mechanosensitive channel
MDDLYKYLHPGIREFLDLPVLPSGGHGLTIGMIVHVSVLLALLIFVTKRLKRWLIERVLARTSFDVGFRYSLGAVLSYAILTLGLLIILDTAGINTTAVTVVAGALGLGVSLSLQTIISNCFAGLFILLERRIKVGDRVQIGDLIGRVTDISLRASSLLTNDNALVIVPNSDFITSKVINLSYDTKATRVSVPITVDWPSNPDSLIEILTETAAQEKGVLKDRPVEVLLTSFKKNDYNLVVNVWTDEFSSQKEVLQSNLNRALVKPIRQHLDKSSKHDSGH